MKQTDSPVAAASDEDISVSLLKAFDSLVIAQGLLIFIFLQVGTSMTQDEIVSNDIARLGHDEFAADVVKSAGVTIGANLGPMSFLIWGLLGTTCIRVGESLRVPLGFTQDSCWLSIEIAWLAYSIVILSWSTYNLSGMANTLLDLKMPFYKNSVFPGYNTYYERQYIRDYASSVLNGTCWSSGICEAHYQAYVSNISTIPMGFAFGFMGIVGLLLSFGSAKKFRLKVHGKKTEESFMVSE